MEQSFEGDCQKAPGNFVWVKSERDCGMCLMLNQKSRLHLSGRAGRELSLHGGQEQGTEGFE